MGRMSCALAFLFFCSIAEAADISGLPRVVDGDTLVIGATSLRLRGTAFTFATLFFQELVLLIVRKLRFAGGPGGIKLPWAKHDDNWPSSIRNKASAPMTKNHRGASQRAA